MFIQITVRLSGGTAEIDVSFEIKVFFPDSVGIVSEHDEGEFRSYFPTLKDDEL